MIDYKLAVERLADGQDYSYASECFTIHLYKVALNLVIDIDVIETNFEMTYDEAIETINTDTLKEYVNKAINTICKELKKEMRKSFI